MNWYHESSPPGQAAMEKSTLTRDAVVLWTGKLEKPIGVMKQLDPASPVGGGEGLVGAGERGGVEG